MHRRTSLSSRLALLAMMAAVALLFQSAAIDSVASSQQGKVNSQIVGGMGPHVRPLLTNMTWHGGPVMAGVVNVYPIFWEPPGSYVDPNYNMLLWRYYYDVGGNRLYNINRQYRGSNGAPLGTVIRGGWLDNTQADAYPPGTILSPANIAAEVIRAMRFNGWRASIYNYFPVYTAAGAGTTTPFCAYHNFFFVNRQPIVFAHNVYPDGNYSRCQIPSGISPNNCMVCDSAISMSAHEQFEAVTDPLGNGWYYLNTAGEIGDLCENNYGPLNYDNGLANQFWNGRFYIVQMMWNNAKGSCQQGP